MKHFAPIFRWFAILTIAVGCSTYFASKDLVAQTAGQAETADSGDGTASPDKTESADSTEVVGVTFSDPITTNYKVGFQVLAIKNPVVKALVTLPIPNEWPEQTVSVVNETIPPDMGSIYDRELNSGVKQLVVKIPRLQPKTVVEMSMTYQIRTCQVNPPPDTKIFQRPKTSHREGKPYTQSSPEITFRDSKLKKQVKELVTEKATPWEEVEAIYDWVRDEIDIRSGESRDTSKVFKDRYGCAEDVVGLFVAMCRANKIPARMVWVTGKQYAEFMLIDRNKKAHWFPAVLVGPREFGQLSEPLPILQKGDSIRVPEKKQRQKRVAELFECQADPRSKTKTPDPRYKFVRQLQPVN